MAGFWASMGKLALGKAKDIAGAFIPSLQQRQNVKDQIRANRQLAEYAYSKDLEMWNKQNEYNKPEMQMQRLKDAGLNPHLVYGTGTVTGNTSGQMPKYNAPTEQHNYMPVMDIPAMIAQYQDFKLRQETIRTKELENYFLDRTKHWRSNTEKWKMFKTEHDSERSIYDATAALYRSEQEKIGVEKRMADTLFSQYRAQWMKHGITTSDNIFLRMISRQMIESGFESPLIKKKSEWNRTKDYSRPIFKYK